jgi:hypothetical protein
LVKFPDRIKKWQRIGKKELSEDLKDVQTRREKAAVVNREIVFSKK